MNLRVPAGLWPLTLCAALSCAREGDENLGLPPTETAPLAVERTLVPHALLPTASGQQRIVSVACFEALPNSISSGLLSRTLRWR